jgi:shikimate kinase
MKTNIVLIGLSGVGKTTIAMELSRVLNMPYIDSDTVIEEDYGSIPELFKIGEGHFRQIERKVIKLLSSLDRIIIASGGGVVLVPENIEALREKGILFYIKRSIEDIINSIDASKRPLLKGNPIENLNNLYTQRSHLYEDASDYTIDASNMQDAISSIRSIWDKIS